MSNKPCPGTNNRGEPCGFDAGWGVDGVETGSDEASACKFHGGAGGAPEGNHNAVTHGATADPHNIKEYLEEDGNEEDRKWVDTLTGQYIEQSPYTADDPQAERIEMAVIMAWQERSGRAQLIKEGLEREKIVSASEAGVARDLDKHHLNGVVSSLNTDIRQNLKDFGVLNDPESQKAEAIGDLSSIILDESDS